MADNRIILALLAIAGTAYASAGGGTSKVSKLAWGPEIIAAANKNGIDPVLAAAVVAVESWFNIRAVSPTGALGLMQLLLSTARDLDPQATREKLFEPVYNLDLGCRYLAMIRDRWRIPLPEGVEAYNVGPNGYLLGTRNPDYKSRVFRRIQEYS